MSGWGRRGVGLELRRLMLRRFAGSKLGLAIENVVQPLFVALVVTYAYLARSESGAFRNGFMYFTTLYAFWVGLFGSCQSVNRELQTREWSYWVLGFRRNKYLHMISIFCANFLVSLLQVIVFVFFLMGVGCLADGALEHFIEMFVSDDQSLGAFLFQMGSVLHPYLCVKFGPLIGPLGLSLVVFVLAELLAALSGCGFGLVFSVWFRAPAVSLNVSVGFVVLLGMLSLCGLKPTEDVDQWDRVDKAFLPEIERSALREVHPDKIMPKTAVSGMVWLSRLYPQRYFFNVARIMARRELDDEVLGRMVTDNVTLKGKDVPYWLRVKKGQYCRPGTCKDHYKMKSWIGVNAPDANEEGETEGVKAIDFLKEYLCRHPEVSDRWQPSVCCRLIARAVWQESMPILLTFGLCLLAAAIGIWRKTDVYQELR